jgi:hypothetical protein
MSRTLSRREKTLAAIVAAVVFVFANFFLLDWCWKSVAKGRTEIVTKRKQLAALESLSEQRDFWEQRSAWLTAKQPKLASSDDAAVQLLNKIKDLARKHEVLLERPSIRVAERQPEYVSISVEVETKSAWKPLIGFLRELQSPEQFIAVESASLKIDTADATQMRGRFRIAQWYAPQ